MLNTISLFSGIGAFEVSMDQENIDWKLAKYCEIDKEVSNAYNLLHGTTNDDNLGDIKIAKNQHFENIDLVTYGFPCQDISLAGKGAGFFDEKGNQTRSGLFFDAVDFIQKTKPKFAIFENVKNLTSSKFKKEFNAVITALDDIGYNTYWQVLNSADYESAQSRERVYGISIRKDIDKGFKFPTPLHKKHSVNEFVDFRECDDLTNNFYKRYITLFGFISESEFRDYLESLPIKENKIHTKKLNLYNFSEMDTITMTTGLTGTLTCRNVQNYNKKYYFNGKLYKPSPKMCFRLMGFDDSYFEKLSCLPDKLLYNIAGNTIVIDVLRAIFKELKNQYPEYFVEKHR